MNSIILPVASILACAALCAWEWHKIVLGRAAISWPRTDGLVVDARFDESVYPSDDDAVYSAHLVFEYTVRGRRYRSRRFTYRPMRHLEQAAAYALLRGIRRGQTVDVHYDPKRPERAVVLPGIDRGNLFSRGFWGAGMAVAGVWLAMVWSTAA